MDEATLAQGGNPVLAADHGSAQCVAMAADVLGQRMHHVVGAKRQRLGAEWGGNGCIDRELSCSSMGDLSDGGYVRQTKDWIGRCLNVDELGVRSHCCSHSLKVRRVDGVYSDAVPGQNIVGKLCDAA